MPRSFSVDLNTEPSMLPRILHNFLGSLGFTRLTQQFPKFYCQFPLSFFSFNPSYDPSVKVLLCSLSELGYGSFGFHTLPTFRRETWITYTTWFKYSPPGKIKMAT